MKLDKIASVSILALLLLVTLYKIGNEQKVVSVQRDVDVMPSENHRLLSSGTTESLEYFNVKDKSFLLEYPSNGPVIAILLATREEDLKDICVALKSLVFLGGDDPKHPAPVLIFNEGDVSIDQKVAITSCTKRPVAYPLVNFTSFPDGFDGNVESKMFRVGGRKEWGYYHMVRFWITGIWKHPALEPYETIMRIDTDSCFKEKNPILPNFKYNDLVYYSQYVGLEDGKKYTIGLLEFAESFMKKVGRYPASPMLWDFIKLSWEMHQSLPVFMTNFELSRKSFMLHPEVMAWHEALTEQEPFGVYKYRWGDAVERFLTAVMFASNDRIMMSEPTGYGHKQSCPKLEEMEQIIASKNK